MTDRDLPPEADALDSYLDVQTPAAPLSAADSALVDSLMAAASAAQPDPAFARALEQQLAASAVRRRSPSSAASIFNPFLWSDPMRKFFAFALTTGAVTLLLIGGLWILARTYPGPLANDTATVAVTTQPPPTSLPVPTATVLPELQSGLVFPEGPEQVRLYRQLPFEALTVDNAKAIAARLGVAGHVYQSTGEGGPGMSVYEVTDGVGNVRVVGVPGYFYFTPDEYNSFAVTGAPLPFEQRAAISGQFLKRIGLFDFEYRLQPSSLNPSGVLVVRLLDGRPLLVDQSFEQNNVLTLSAGGQVQSLIALLPQVEALDEYPILSAREAWQSLNDPQSTRGVSSLSQMTPAYDENYRLWVPQYLPGERVDLYGYPVAFQSAEPGLPPMISINNIKILESTDALAAEANPGRFMHVWGVFQPGGFELEGWEATALADDYVRGTLEREGDFVYLATGGQRLLLRHVPAGIAAGNQVDVRGVRVDGSEFAWSTMNTAVDGGGGGGGGGGSSFAEISLTPAAQRSTPTPAPFPYVVGDTVTGADGILGVIYFRQANGSRRDEVRLVMTGEGLPLGTWSMLLEGEALAGIDAYNHLPLRIDGTVTAVDGRGVVVNVAHYEEVYPGLRLQAWRGTQSIETLDGRRGIVFTAADGTRYVSLASLNLSKEDFDPGITLVGAPGTPAVAIGYVKPGETLAGYPVLTDVSTTMDDGVKSLEAYAAEAAQPFEVPFDHSERSVPEGTLETVELVYLANDFTHGWPPPPHDCPCRIIQPVWRFTGHSADGQTFSIVIQALADEYLK
jgi:hypothetical protein